MNHDRAMEGNADLFKMWTDLSYQYAEMMMDSARVVNCRVGLASTAPISGDSERDELSLMVREKIDASTESVQEVMSGIMTWNGQLWLQAMKHLMALATAMSPPTDTQGIGQSWFHQIKLVTVMGETSIMTVCLPDSVIHLAHRGLKPFHSRVEANAQRLAGAVQKALPSTTGRRR